MKKKTKFYEKVFEAILLICFLVMFSTAIWLNSLLEVPLDFPFRLIPMACYFIVVAAFIIHPILALLELPETTEDSLEQEGELENE